MIFRKFNGFNINLISEIQSTNICCIATISHQRTNDLIYSQNSKPCTYPARPIPRGDECNELSPSGFSSLHFLRIDKGHSKAGIIAHLSFAAANYPNEK